MTDEHYKISNSDIKDFNKCEYRWYFGRYLNLTPLELPEVMEVGTFGHSLMEEAFKVIKAGGSYEEAAEESGKLLLTAMNSPLKMKVYKNVLAFVAWFQQQEYRVIDIEDKQHYELSSDYAFGFTPDLTVEHTVGPTRGSQSVMDYKFTGQYWNDRQINAFQQVPRYIHFKNLRTGSNISRGAVVMLNTRATPTDTGNKLFLVKWLPINRHRLKLLERETEVMTERIHRMYQIGQEQGDEALKAKLTHSADEYGCRLCFFADDLCPMDQMGKDISRSIKHNFKLNTGYGYNNEEKNEHE